METLRQQSEASNSMQEASGSSSPGPPSPSSSSLGWPFGLSTCMVIHTPSPKDLASCQTPLAFHQQFINLQTTFLLPFFSDADVSSSSDTDSRRSEGAASSFFKDSRRITLGTLIGLPMDNSFRIINHPEARYRVFSARRRNFLPSCGNGILEFLGSCVRNVDTTSLPEVEFSEPVGREDEAEVAPASSSSLAAYLHLESSTNPSDPALISVLFEDALSDGSHSPDWNDQFVSCHSILSDGEWTGRHQVSERVPTPIPCVSAKSTPRHHKSTQKMQRNGSMKSFFSSICCKIDTVNAP